MLNVECYFNKALKRILFTPHLSASIKTGTAYLLVVHLNESVFFPSLTVNISRIFAVNTGNTSFK